MSQRRSTPGRPRTKPAEERRADLLDAAERVFVGRGIDAARLDEITDHADVSIGTLYFHFRSKHDLLVAVRARFIDRLVERQDAAVRRLPADDWIGRVDAWLSDAVRAYVEHAELHDVLYDHTPLNAKTTIQVTPENAHVEAFRRLIAERPDPPPDAPNPAMAANLIYSAWYGATHALLHHEAVDIDQLADELIADITDLAHRYLRIEP
ncbi:DNA-binding transcriptional regulator, AcrR family [Sinosporangium album]|uniref:DNA-binding transcriptional regulator, AcrR family n=1 Tax=Sinosporangium album TaxID=504805 RepID=A0A1G8K376_9ACTN|nr:TetR/AcrR family transcriptional regulator [Sinosporangium album]SDI37926.1 DNA-binding transcriptional regulator, AcrR family [Sinosporangium album]